MSNTDTSTQELREQLWDIMGRRNKKILDAQKTDALVLPYFEADDEAATEIIALINTRIAAVLTELENEKESQYVGSGYVDFVPLSAIQSLRKEVSANLTKEKP